MSEREAPAAMTFEEFSAAARYRLLSISFERLVFSFSAVPLVGLVFSLWMRFRQAPALPVNLWIAAYIVAALGVYGLYRRFARDRRRQAERRTRFWTQMLKCLAALHGAGLIGLYLVTWNYNNFDFILLINISIAAIIAGNSTHLTPVFAVFKLFFLICWLGLLVMIPIRFNDTWPLVLFLNLLYGAAIYRHALSTHRFFNYQLQLEEQSSRLAENFRQARDAEQAAKVEAEQALFEKNRFLTTASHDLRQPVHAMGFLIASIIERNVNPALRQPLMDLQSSVRSVHLMFNSLLDLSRLEAGHLTGADQPVEVTRIVHAVVDLFREEARNRQLQLRVWLPPRDIWIGGDENMLQQSLVNLVQNALKFTVNGGVLIAVRQRRAGVLVEVWDTGVGIADAEKDKVFSEYYRAELAWQLDSAGHGLGLAVVARYAELMQAQLSMQSLEGRGSRFRLQLCATTAPISDRVAPVSPDESRPAGGSHTLRGRCLVIDDDPVVTGAWQALLGTWGVELRCASGAAEAFSAVAEGFVPQAILCDQRLRSGESGFAILQALLARFPQASGAMVSGEFNSPILLQAEEAGYLVLRKPLEPAVLHALLRDWFAT